MIPKIIHYCWFGGNPMPKSAIDCIESWKKFLPDYEIKEWNESNFNVNIVTYTTEAYLARKYAFVSDYARFWILYNYGGIYFDTDVEILKPMNDIIDRGPFMGLENLQKNDGIAINPGLGISCNIHNKFYKEILNLYKNLHFISWKGEVTGTVVKHITNLVTSQTSISINQINFYKGIYIYPKDYFAPKNYFTGEINITENTRSIHRYNATWMTKRNKFQRGLDRLHNIGIRIYTYIYNFSSSN